MSADSLEDDFGILEPIKDISEPIAKTVSTKQKVQKTPKAPKNPSDLLANLGFALTELPPFEMKDYSYLLSKLYQEMPKPLIVKSHTKIKVLIVCSSALRTLEIIKDLKQTRNLAVAKLFARHLKLPEQLEMLKSQTWHVGVGTPDRILKLLTHETEPIKLSKLEMLIIDGSHRDKKTMSVADLHETKQALADLANIVRQLTVTVYNF